MKIIHSRSMEMWKASEPQPITVKEHKPKDNAPLKLDNGAIAMPGDFYSEKVGIVIAAGDIGASGAWEEVK